MMEEDSGDYWETDLAGRNESSVLNFGDGVASRRRRWSHLRCFCCDKYAKKTPTLAVLITAVEWEVCASLSKSAGQIRPALYFSTHLFPIWLHIDIELKTMTTVSLYCQVVCGIDFEPQQILDVTEVCLSRRRCSWPNIKAQQLMGRKGVLGTGRSLPKPAEPRGMTGRLTDWLNDWLITGEASYDATFDTTESLTPNWGMLKNASEEYLLTVSHVKIFDKCNVNYAVWGGGEMCSCTVCVNRKT